MVSALPAGAGGPGGNRVVHVPGGSRDGSGATGAGLRNRLLRGDGGPLHRRALARGHGQRARAADGKVRPLALKLVSWLAGFHDMGLLVGVPGTLTMGLHSVLMSPMAFLQRPARWVQQLAKNTRTFTAVPNFAFELAARRTSDADMAGLDLGQVHTLLSGSERVRAATIRRFIDLRSEFECPASAL